MRVITLSEEEWELLNSELSSLYMYHWNDDSKHADDCGSKTLEFLESRTQIVENNTDSKGVSHGSNPA